MIKSVLIANRGEIAIRIARTARRMGIVTYAIRTRKEPEAVYLSSVDIVLDFPETDGNVPEFLDIDRLIIWPGNMRSSLFIRDMVICQRMRNWRNGVERTGLFLLVPRRR